MSGTTEASARVKIDALLKDAGWNLIDGASVLFEYLLPDGTLADYVLCDRQGRPMAALEAKRASVDPILAQDQGRHYAEQLGVPFVFLSNGEEVWFLDREADAHARRIAGFYAQDDLERRIAARSLRRDLATVGIDRAIVDRYYQIACIEALCAEVSRGRRRLLVEMATGTGKTRTAAAFVKRMFEAGIVTRVLFLVDRIALAGQAEDAFTDHLRDYPCHDVRHGVRILAQLHQVPRFAVARAAPADDVLVGVLRPRLFDRRHRSGEHAGWDGRFGPLLGGHGNGHGSPLSRPAIGFRGAPAATIRKRGDSARQAPASCPLRRVVDRDLVGRRPAEIAAGELQRDGIGDAGRERRLPPASR